MRHPATRILLAVLLLAAVVGVGIASVSKQLRTGSDFPIYYHAARALLEGRSPYDVSSGLHGYVYLPFFALLLAPLALLPLPAASFLWYLASLAFAAASTAIAIRVVRGGDAASLPAVTAAATVVPLLGLFHDNLILGQANLLLLPLVLSGAAGLVASRPRAAPAALLGVAAALKMNAAIFLVPLLVRARFRPVAGFAAGAVAAFLLPFLLLGPARGLDLASDWRAKVVTPAAAGTLQGSKIWDQSPQAALRRLLVDAPAYDGVSVHVASLSPEQFARVGRSASAAIVTVLVFVWIVGREKGSREAMLLDLGMACCGMLQVVGFNLKAQFVLLLLPGLIGASWAFGTPRRSGGGSRAALLAAAALLLLSNPGIAGRAVSNVMLAYSAITLATLLVLAVLIRARLAVATEPRRSSPARTA
jgi:hypothetical protein